MCLSASHLGHESFRGGLSLRDLEEHETGEDDADEGSGRWANESQDQLNVRNDEPNRERDEDDPNSENTDRVVGHVRLLEGMGMGGLSQGKRQILKSYSRLNNWKSQYEPAVWSTAFSTQPNPGLLGLSHVGLSRLVFKKTTLV